MAASSPHCTPLLLTRPRAESLRIAKQIPSHFHTIISPVITIEWLADSSAKETLKQSLIDPNTAFITTSKNGITALANQTSSREMRLLTVGQASADYAQSLGFTHAIRAGKNSQELLAYFQSGAISKDTSLCYVRGRDVHGNLSTALQNEGFSVTEHILYQAQEASQFTNEAVKAITELPTIIMVFSNRSYCIIDILFKNHDLEDYRKNTKILCLSQAIAEAIPPQTWRQVYHADEPIEQSMLDSLKRFD